MQPKKSIPVTDYKKTTPQVNITQPTITLELPSKGLVYPKDSYLSGGKIEIRYMTGRDENVFANQSYIKSGLVLEMLLKSLCSEPTFEPLDLVLADKIFLLIAIRIMSLGDTFMLKDAVCPMCELRTPTLELSLSAIKDDKQFVYPAVGHLNEYEYVLPASGDKIKLHLMDGHDQQDLLGKVQRTGDKQLFSLLTAKIIVEEPKTKAKDFGSILEYVENLSIRDTQFIRNKIVEISGITEPTIEHTCPKCSHVSPVGISLDTTFFFPQF